MDAATWRYVVLAKEGALMAAASKALEGLCADLVARIRRAEDDLWWVAFRQPCPTCGRGPRWLWRTWRASHVETGVHAMCDRGHRRRVGTLRMAVAQERVEYQVRMDR